MVTPFVTQCEMRDGDAFWSALVFTYQLQRCDAFFCLFRGFVYWFLGEELGCCIHEWHMLHVKCGGHLATNCVRVYVCMYV